MPCGRFLSDPLITAEIEGLAEEFLLAGNDPNDPEVMGAFLKKLRSKVTGAVKKVAGKFGKNKSSGGGYSVQTPKGTLKYGPSGISLTSATQLPASSSVSSTSATGQIEQGLKDPKVMAVVAGGLILFAFTLKKRRGK